MVKKNLAFIVQYFPSITETFIVNQINSMIDLGFNVKLFAYNHGETTEVHESLKRYNLHHRAHYFVKPPINKTLRLLAFFKWISKRKKTRAIFAVANGVYFF